MRSGLPVIVRPSWVIGGRGIAVLRSEADVVDCLATDVGWPLRVDELVAGVELDVDVISDGERLVRPGHPRAAGPARLHSGDCVAVLPPQRLSRAARSVPPRRPAGSRWRSSVRGILNVQMILAGDRVVVIEANPRASRTVPIVAKATGLDVVADAVRCALGSTLADVGLRPGLAPDGLLVAVKAPVGSLWRLPGVERRLGPEMRSTGEVLGLAPDYAAAQEAARQAEAVHLVAGDTRACHPPGFHRA